MSGWAPRTKLTEVWATHRFVGFHNWPSAPTGRGYLSDRHRHLFHVRASVEVLHDDRDVEFHDLLDEVAATCSLLGDGDGELGPMSCEQIALEVCNAVTKKWPGRAVACEVSEDGEAGASVRLA